MGSEVQRYIGRGGKNDTVWSLDSTTTPPPDTTIDDVGCSIFSSSSSSNHRARWSSRSLESFRVTFLITSLFHFHWKKTAAMRFCFSSAWAVLDRIQRAMVKTYTSASIYVMTLCCGLNECYRSIWHEIIYPPATKCRLRLFASLSLSSSIRYVRKSNTSP